jgi:hypothetical protein
MNYIKVLIFFIFTLPIISNGQIQLHPTIEKLNVSYMTSTDSLVIPEVTIYIKSWVNVSKIHFRIKDTLSSVIKYSVDYDLVNLPIMDSLGHSICLKSDMFIQLSATMALQLKPYIYEVQTEDSIGGISLNYSQTEELEP